MISGVVRANGIGLAYQSDGAQKREVVLLIPGVGDQLGSGPTPLAQELIARGYRVIAYDSRDSGASTHMSAAGMPNWTAINAAMAAGKAPPVAYTLGDLAADAVGLLDALGIASAHIVGGSLGGMVAQTVAADHANRTLSLTSISSSTGNPALPLGPASSIVSAPSTAGDFQAVVAHQLAVARALEGSGYRLPDEVLRARVVAAMQKPTDPAGVARQGAATAVGGDRRNRLRTITAPTAVVHGDADLLFPVEHGRDTAATIPGATLDVIAGMGHELPDVLVPRVAGDIIEAATRRVRT